MRNEPLRIQMFGAKIYRFLDLTEVASCHEVVHETVVRERKDSTLHY